MIKSFGIFALLFVASFVASQDSQGNTTCGDYIQYFCSVHNGCPQPQQSSTPIITVKGNSIDLRDFNAVSFDNFVARTGDVQGRVACSGNFLAGNGFSIGDQLEAQGTNISSSTYPYGLIVGGNAIWGSGRMYSEGIFVASHSTGDVFHQASSIDSCEGQRENCLQDEFSSAKRYFVQISEYFATQQVNVRRTIQYSTLSIQCNASSDLYVLNLSASELSSVTSYQVSSSCNTSALWLFNVIGRDSVTFRGDFFRQSAISILWNIVGEDRTVNVFTQVRGNILAPRCSFTQPGGVVEGNVIAGNMALVLQFNTPICLPIGGGAVIPPSLPSPPSINNETQQAEFCPFWEKNCEGFEFSLNTSEVSFKNYHVISFGNFIANTGDIEGRLAVRNDLVLGCGYSIGFQLSTGGENATELPEEHSLLVGNNARWCSGALFPDGSGSPFEGERESMFVGGQLTAPAYLQLRKSSSSCSNCLASAFSSARACYTSISNSYTNMKSNMNITSQFSTLNITCESSNESQYVAFLSGEQLSQATDWVLSSTCNKTAFYIINIMGNESLTFTGGSIPLPASNVLYNILGCGRIINVITGVNGAILAPYNILNQTGGVIIGKVVVGDVLFALQINIVRCPLNLQENTTMPVNETSQNSTSGASTMVTTGGGSLTAGGIIPPTSGGESQNMTSGGNETEGGFEECPILNVGETSGNTNETDIPFDESSPMDSFSSEIPRAGIKNSVHNSGAKVTLFAFSYLLALLF